MRRLHKVPRRLKTGRSHEWLPHIATLRDVPRVASPIHTGVVLFVLLGFAWFGTIRADRMRSAVHPPSRLSLYASTITFEWLIAGFIWWGMRRNGTPLRVHFAEKHPSLWRDAAIAAGFWIFSVLILATLSRMLNVPPRGRNVQFLFPHGPLEIGVFVLLVITAGICEEVIFRGYLQPQFAAFLKSVPAGLALSALVFGAGHLYQGWRSAIVITAYGAMFGILAERRGSLRPGMLAHTWQDAFSGLVGGLMRP